MEQDEMGRDRGVVVVVVVVLLKFTKSSRNLLSTFEIY